MENKVRILVAMENEAKAREFMNVVAKTVGERGYIIKDVNPVNVVLRTKHTETAFIYDRVIQRLDGLTVDAIFGVEPWKSLLACYLKPNRPYDVGMGLVDYICDMEKKGMSREMLKCATDQYEKWFKKNVMRREITGVTVHHTGYIHSYTTPAIKDVIFNPPATIVFWEDGTKTVVQSRDDDIYDPEKGLSMAISKKALGNTREYYHTFKHWLKKYGKKTGLDKLTEVTFTGTLDSFNADLLNSLTLGPGDITLTFEAKDVNVK